MDAGELREEDGKKRGRGQRKLSVVTCGGDKRALAQHQCPIGGKSRGEEPKENGAPLLPASAPLGGETQRRKDSPKRSESVGRGEESGGHRIGNNKE